MKINLWVILVHFALLFLSACSLLDVNTSKTVSESSVFMAQDVDNEIIQFIWLELPVSIKPGSADVRLFLAKIEPPEPTIPNPNDLRCGLSSSDEYAILGPETITFEFNEGRTFEGNYTYKACPDCIECYMNWDYTLNITGSVSRKSVLLDIAVQHIGLNVPGSFMSAELEPARNYIQEPRISCNQSIECKEIKFVDRD